MSKRNILLNETGQMAVFIALIFQVLFVLFAMVINIGLIVHDKINLQNSVDLAAYYAASKQAESMNMIAHINYQMRQDYKLLAWRYRVLGSFGSDQPFHPAITRGGKLSDIPFVGKNGLDDASVCIGHKGWNDMWLEDKDGNQCKTVDMEIPELVPLKYNPLSLGINEAVVANFSSARQIIRKNCQEISPYNWGLATVMIASFRLSISERKRQIQKISSAMSKDENFLDVDGQSVREGALKTFEKNLTASNKGSLKNDGFEIINGLAQGGCNQPNELGFPDWLVDIPIAPIVRYTELIADTRGVNSCSAKTKSYDQVPNSRTIATIDPSGKLRQLASEPSGKDMMRSSRGFEKNPWCLAYVAIKAKTKPRKIFAPFGEPIEMTAKAIAQPFGGRIGPWYGKTWPSRAARSDQNDPVDALAVPRGDFDVKYKHLYLPNYSRFPGDKLGLRSQLSLGLMREAFSKTFYSITSAGKFNYSDYEKILENFWTSGDPLAWSKADVNGTTRRLEIAAVVPDLFDLAYYSIDPNFHDAYLKRSKETLLSGVTPISDIGSRAVESSLKPYSVKTQFESMKEFSTDAPDAYFLAKDWKHILTGWMQGGAVEYTSRAPAVADNFGECAKWPSDQQPPVPGGCIAGGRVGYSVRLIHKEYLFGEHKFGGEGAGADRIRNLPSDF